MEINTKQVLFILGIFAVLLAIIFTTYDSASERKRQRDIEECMTVAYQNYSRDWDNQCDAVGEKADCSLPTSQSLRLEQTLENNKDRCISRYQQK